MKPYRRRLSREDAETGTILITKNRWGDFPPPMREFRVRVGRTTYPTRVVAEDCACVPPPHQHYHLEAGHFAGRLRFLKGEIIEIEGRGDTYHLRNG